MFHRALGVAARSLLAASWAVATVPARADDGAAALPPARASSQGAAIASDQDEAPPAAPPRHDADPPDAAPGQAAAPADRPPADRRQADEPAPARPRGGTTITSRLPPTRDATPPAPPPGDAGTSPPPPRAGSARGDLQLTPASLNGVRPGFSTQADVEAAWGLPKRVAGSGAGVEHVYALAPFEQVIVTYDRQVVSTIVVELRSPHEPDVVERELRLDGFEPVTIGDQHGEPLGQAYPERGVAFGYAAGDPTQVVHILLEPIAAEPFVLRAEARRQTHDQAALVDLEVAARLEPDHATARRLRAEVLLAAGRSTAALAEARRAIELAPDDSAAVLTLAEALTRTGDYASAGATIERLLRGELPPTTAAQGSLLAGDIAADGPRRDLRAAAQHYLRAIQRAQQGLGDADPAVAAAARRTLVRAHLAMADAVARGNWRDKPAVVGQWLDKAAAVAGECDPPDDDLAFAVAADALAAQVGLQQQAQLGRWGELALARGRALIDRAEDPLRRRRLQWDLGMALYDALQIHQTLLDYDAALDYGRQAIDFLETGAEGRDDSPGDAYLMGRLYFRVGVLHAMHLGDHAAAVAWFEKAIPLVTQPVPDSSVGDVGRQGETLVSMAVSYWETGARREAVELTERGIGLMQQAVEQGILAPRELAVPYGNLAFMHRREGDDQQAARFEALAAQPEQGVRR